MGFFGNREHSTSPPGSATGESPKRESIFHHRSSSTSSPDQSRRSSRRLSHSAGWFFGRHPHEDVHEDVPEDPSLVAAREELARAERAEIRADRMAVRAAGATNEARENVKRLEREAKQ